MDMEAGGNATTLLRQMVEEIVALEVASKELDKDRRERVKELKEQGCPVVIALALMRGAPLDDDQIEAHKRASALTSKPVYVIAESFSATDAGVSKQDMDEHGAGLTDVASLATAAKEQRQEIKEKYAALKGAGFVVKVVKRVVRYKLNPKAQRKEEEADALLETYVRALA